MAAKTVRVRITGVILNAAGLPPGIAPPPAGVPGAPPELFQVQLQVGEQNVSATLTIPDAADLVVGGEYELSLTKK